MANTTVNVMIQATDRASQQARTVQNSLRGIDDAMKRAKAGSTMLAGAVAGVGVASVMAFSSFDDAMRQVEATMGDKLGKSIKEIQKNTDTLRNKAEEMGATTAFSATQASQGMLKLAQAGWDVDQVVSGIGPMLNLASAGALDLDTAADIVTDTMAQFQMQANEASRAADIFAKTASSTNTDITQLGEAMKYAGGEASAVGMSLFETNAVLGYFANTGLKGSMAGTTFNAMLRDMRNKAKDGAIAIGEQNIALYDSEGNMRSLIDIMEDVEKATDGMTGKQRDQALSSVFQVEAMKGVNSILNQGVDGLKNLSNELDNSKGAAKDMAEHMEGGIGGSFRAMMSAVEGVSIALGEKLSPAVTAVMDVISDALLIVIDFIKENEHFELVAGIIAGAILAGMVPAFYALATAVWSAMAPLLPFLAIGAAVGALAYLIYSYWDPISKWFVDTFGGLFDAFKEFFMGIWELVQPVLSDVYDFISQKVGEVKVFWEENWESIKEAFTNIWSFISGFIEFVLGVILDIFEFVWPAIESIVIPIWEGIMQAIDGALQFIMGLIQIFAGLFTGDWDKLWEGIKNILSGILDFIWGTISSTLLGVVLNLIVDFVTGAVKWFSDLASKVTNTISNFVSKIIKSHNEMVSKVVAIISDWVSNVVGKVTGFVSDIVGKISNLNQRMRQLFQDGWSKIKNIISKGIDNTLSTIKNMASSFLNAGKGLLESLTKGIKSGIEKAKGAVKDGMSAIRNLLPFSPAKEGPLRDLDKSGESFFPTWYEGAIKNAPKVTKAISGVMDTMNQELSYENEGLQLFTGYNRVVVVHEHKHSGEVVVEGKDNKEVIDFTKENIVRSTEESIFKELRHSIRRR